MVTVVCALKDGGDFAPGHVQWLAKQVPGLVCVTNERVPGVRTLAPADDYPGWWSKMNAFCPQVFCGDMLMLDLDTVVVGGIEDIAAIGTTTMLSDFYYPSRPASGLMYVTHADRCRVWDRWRRNPKYQMGRCGKFGDQMFVGESLPHARRWQKELPGQVISYKVHVCTRVQSPRGVGNGHVPAGARVVCFHGKPRPWDTQEPWVPMYPG